MLKDLKKLILYPIAIYLIISVEIAAIVVLGVDSNEAWVWSITTVFVAALLFSFAFYAKPANFKKGLIMGAVWAGIFILLDVVIVAVPFTGFGYFMDVRTWIPYIIGILAPTIMGLIFEKKTDNTC